EYSTPSRGSIAATTTSAPAMAGTASSPTNQTASTRGPRASASRFTSSARAAGSSTTGSFWRPSRGPTSHTITFMALRRPGGAAALEQDVHEHRSHREDEDRRPDHVDLRKDGGARGAPDEERERHRRAGVEVRDHEVVDRERKRQQQRGEDPRRDQRERDTRERRPLVRAEIHGGLFEVTVEADQPRLHGYDDVADVEHDVSDDDRQEAGRDVDRQEEREQRGAEHELGRRHRQEDQQVRRAAPAEAVADERERDQRPERGRADARDRRHLERHLDRAP